MTEHNPQDRVLGRRLARQLSAEELEIVAGGTATQHTNGCDPTGGRFTDDDRVGESEEP